jgi:hypothetical protein
MIFSAFSALVAKKSGTVTIGHSYTMERYRTFSCRPTFAPIVACPPFFLTTGPSAVVFFAVMSKRLSRILLVLLAVGSLAWQSQNETTAFSICFDPALSKEPLSGRIILMLSKANRFSPTETGTPFFGLNVDDLKPGEPALLDANAAGYPVRSLSQLPAGDYYVQAYLNVYTTFHRADGRTVKLHGDQGEGQNWRRSPGNIHSQPQVISFDPLKGGTIPVVMNRKIPPIEIPKDTEWIKTIRIQSKLLTKFWGTPMYLGARVLVPRGFRRDLQRRYPVIYTVGHFSMANPGGFRDEPDNAMYRAWNSPDFPEVLLVTMQHACPYYDDSYGVNSENVGPYGDAITRELIPYLETEFRAIAEPFARTLTGGSTGGWIALAMQFFYPEFFGGTWSFSPDPVDFRKYQIVNLYDDANAYFQETEWVRVPRPARRETDGNVAYTMEQENLKEEVLGTRCRSGGQWAIWNAVFAPVGEDGYPKPFWDPQTGKIDHAVAEWAKEHYDLRYYLEKHWGAVGPKLEGKINVFVGRMDNFYLNEAVAYLDEFFSRMQNPRYPARFEYGERGGHGWSPYKSNIDLYREMASHMAKIQVKK